MSFHKSNVVPTRKGSFVDNHSEKVITHLSLKVYAGLPTVQSEVQGHGEFHFRGNLLHGGELKPFNVEDLYLWAPRYIHLDPGLCPQEALSALVPFPFVFRLCDLIFLKEPTQASIQRGLKRQRQSHVRAIRNARLMAG